MKEFKITTKEWHRALLMTATSVLSYSGMISKVITELRIELDTQENDALDKATNDMMNAIRELKQVGKVTPMSDMAYRILALLLDNLEAYKTIQENNLNPCDCEKCAKVDNAYKLAKKRITVLASTTVTDL